PGLPAGRRHLGRAAAGRQRRVLPNGRAVQQRGRPGPVGQRDGGRVPARRGGRRRAASAPPRVPPGDAAAAAGHAAPAGRAAARARSGGAATASTDGTAAHAAARLTVDGPAPSGPWPQTLAGQQAVMALLSRWDDAAAAALFTENVAWDRALDRRQQDIAQV